jgi:hypothetical protein
VQNAGRKRSTVLRGYVLRATKNNMIFQKEYVKVVVKQRQFIPEKKGCVKLVI